MEVCSPRQQLITNLQGSNTKDKGAWQKLIKKTSGDGFVHGNPRPHSPIKQATYTKGSWEDFIKRSDMIIEKKGIRIPPHKKDHFELGYGTIALLDEKDLFNLRGQKRINIAQKKSQVFDAYRKTYSTNIMSEKDRLLWIERYRSDYTKFHHSDYPTLQKSTNHLEFSNDVLKQKATPKEGGYLAISEAKKEQKWQKQQINIFKSDAKQTKRSIQENYQTISKESSIFPNQYPISYEQYKSISKVKSASPSVILQQNSANVAEVLSPRQQDKEIERQRPVRKALSQSEQNQKFIEYKNKYDSVKLI